jgi:hypothetical protein
MGLTKSAFETFERNMVLIKFCQFVG